ncbi:MAG: ATP synthase F1 subunit delta [Eubacteriales bacterium]|nr:ATP synthase F1 subunit delta [Eubacteriales bacterium]MDD4390369.1 ATP synthase F1 subunit delta [Eubacteriales bacterium]
MAELTVAMTYGDALFQAGKDLDKIDIIAEEAHAVLGILKEEPQFCDVINSPCIPADEKKKLLRAVFQGKICDELLNLWMILVNKRRTIHFENIVRVYDDLRNREEGLAYGKVVSMNPLTEQQLLRFEDETSKLLKEKVRLENETDKSLIGGVKILIDGKIIDATIRKRLSDLTDIIK